MGGHDDPEYSVQDSGTFPKNDSPFYAVCHRRNFQLSAQRKRRLGYSALAGLYEGLC